MTTDGRGVVFGGVEGLRKEEECLRAFQNADSWFKSETVVRWALTESIFRTLYHGVCSSPLHHLDLQLARIGSPFTAIGPKLFQTNLNHR